MFSKAELDAFWNENISYGEFHREYDRRKKGKKYTINVKLERSYPNDILHEENITVFARSIDSAHLLAKEQFRNSSEYTRKVKGLERKYVSLSTKTY